MHVYREMCYKCTRRSQFRRDWSRKIDEVRDSAAAWTAAQTRHQWNCFFE